MYPFHHGAVAAVDESLDITLAASGFQRQHQQVRMGPAWGLQEFWLGLRWVLRRVCCFNVTPCRARLCKQAAYPAGLRSLAIFVCLPLHLISNTNCCFLLQELEKYLESREAQEGNSEGSGEEGEGSSEEEGEAKPDAAGEHGHCMVLQNVAVLGRKSASTCDVVCFGSKAF